MEGSDRLTVVSEFRVVVVFDDRRASGRCPLDDGMSPFWAQDDAGGRLMCRGEDHSARVGRREGFHVDSVHVHRYGDDVQSQRPADRVVVGIAGILDGYGLDAVVGERVQEQLKPLRIPGAYERMGRLCGCATDSSKIRGEYLAQFRAAVGVGVAEQWDRRISACAAYRAAPVFSGKAREIGHGGPEVDAGRLAVGGPRRKVR